MTGMSEGGMDAAPSGVEPSAPVQSQEKLKVKIDGLEDEVDLEDLKRDYQKYRSSEKRFQEASELRKKAQEESQLVAQFLNKAQSGDLSWLKGFVPEDQIRKFAESELLEYIDWESKPDIERRAIQAEREREKLQKQLEELNQSKEKETHSKVEAQAYEEIEQDIVQAVKTMGYDYKATPRFIRRIAEQMYASIAASDDPQAKGMPAKDATSRAFNSLKVDATELLSILPIEDALEMLPPKLRKRIRQADIESVRAQDPMRSRPDLSPKGVSKKSKFKRMSTDQAFEKMEKRFS